MLAKLTSKNQLTLPKVVTGSFHGVEYFDLLIANGCIVRAPASSTPVIGDGPFFAFR